LTRRLIALTRPVSPSLARCELTHLAREPIDVGRAAAQHAAYEETLRALGCDVRHLPAAPDHPDAVFVEDTAVVLEEAAVITRPGAASRRDEVDEVARVLAAFRPLFSIAAPGTLDGGDVLVVGRVVFVGLSARTNAEGAAQLARVIEPLGYAVRTLAVSECLHLKSAATAAAPGTVLLNPGWVDARAFAAFERIEVDPSEPFGANVVDAGAALVYAAAFPRTRERLERHGLSVRTVEMDELAKAEGAVTCCSLLLAADGAPANT
jgi:dimethylargininase